MQNVLRNISVIVAIILVVGVVTYLQQQAPPQPNGNVGASVATANGQPLVFAERRSVWDSKCEIYGMEFDKDAKGHYDFWVANQDDYPTSVELTYNSCQCANVELGFPDMAEVAAAAPNLPLLGSKGFDEAALNKLKSLNLQNTKWVPLEKNKLHQIPAVANGGQRLALVRLDWKSKNMGPNTIVAKISYYGRDPKATAELALEANMVVVDPVQVFPNTFKFGDLRNGETRSFDYIIWSSTRDQAPLVLPDVSSNPCLVFGKPVPLTPEEKRLMLEKPIGQPGILPLNSPPTKVRVGWRVPLTIHESLNGNQLELGPLYRRLVFNAGTEFEAPITIEGRVRGEIRLVDEKEDDRIKLGDFRADRPVTRVFYVTCDNPSVKLEVESHTPLEPGMTVDLKQEVNNTGTWRLKITIQPDTLLGQLSGQAVILRTVGPNPRKVRIPIQGTAYVQ